MTPLVAVAGRTGAPSKVSRDEVAFAGKRYLHSLLRAGGEPVVIAPQQFANDDAAELMSRFDALLLMGGPDVDPSLYGQKASPQVYGVSPQPAHAPENSISGRRNWDPLTVPVSSDARSGSGRRRKKSHAARSRSRRGGCGTMSMALWRGLARSLAGQTCTQSEHPVQSSGATWSV